MFSIQRANAVPQRFGWVESTRRLTPSASRILNFLQRDCPSFFLTCNFFFFSPLIIYNQWFVGVFFKIVG